MAGCPLGEPGPGLKGRALEQVPADSQRRDGRPFSSCTGTEGTYQILLALFSLTFFFSEGDRSSVSGVISLACAFWEKSM